MDSDHGLLTRQNLLEYFTQAATPRDQWRVGMELERLGRRVSDGAPLPYGGDGATVRRVLETIHERRGGEPVMEAQNIIGIDAPWGGISLEPGGQVEWSSRPSDDLTSLEASLDQHLLTMRDIAGEFGVRWLETAVDPDLPLSDMTWMPKARYQIMRPYLGSRGGLAHRMMTQTASIQCAFDYESPQDWLRKFKASALLTPISVALFANSARIDGEDTGHVCYRQTIWRDTDPDRCGLPSIVFEPHFDLEAWLDWILAVPTIFRHRGRGLVPAGGVPFSQLMQLHGCDAIRHDDWETHVSTIFTEVRSYTYLEVRSTDVQPDPLVFDVPTFWTGILYGGGDTLEAALRLGEPFDSHEGWIEGVRLAAERGLDAPAGGRTLREVAAEVLGVAVAGLQSAAACVADAGPYADRLERLAERHGLETFV
ncbi:MAG: glutamate--cysteine ligase [bacterium]|nr:glutamate--cysteine ligase [bacterium]